MPYNVTPAYAIVFQKSNDKAPPSFGQSPQHGLLRSVGAHEIEKPLPHPSSSTTPLLTTATAVHSFPPLDPVILRCLEPVTTRSVDSKVIPLRNATSNILYVWRKSKSSSGWIYRVSLESSTGDIRALYPCIKFDHSSSALHARQIIERLNGKGFPFIHRQPRSRGDYRLESSPIDKEDVGDKCLASSRELLNMDSTFFCR
ncbi:hypothetical protein F5I97DRAFT_640705 [Phlebopus sp. FC_14]|nr:hypothetical protein F5I97DRAFT_640705 [Phlebopus sp. FC_14]